MSRTAGSDNAVAENAPATAGPDEREESAAPAPAPRRGAYAIIALGIALVLIGAGVAGLSGRGSRLRLVAGANAPVNQDASSINAHNSPTIVRSPTDAKLLAVAGRIDRPRFSASVNVSHDGGATWIDAPLAVPAGEDRPFNPDLAFDEKGDLHVLFATLTGAGNTPGALWSETSTDGGAAFSPPVKVSGPGAFQARLVAGAKVVRAVWVQAGPGVETIKNGFPQPPNPIVMATSNDGGATFDEPVEVSPRTRERVGVPVPLVTPSGGVDVLYEDFGADTADFDGTATSKFDGRFSLVLARSDDGRAFKEVSVVDSGLVPTAPFLVYTPAAPSLAIDPADGSLYAAWSDNRNRNQDVFLRRSTDDGRSWSDPVRVGDGRNEQYVPAVTVSGKGRVHVLYLDRRDDKNNVLTGASLATSFDHGKTFAVVALSDVISDSGVGPGSEIDRTDAGSRLGVVASGSTVYSVWTDTRRGTRDTGKQDLYFATLRIGGA